MTINKWTLHILHKRYERHVLLCVYYLSSFLLTIIYALFRVTFSDYTNVWNDTPHLTTKASCYKYVFSFWNELLGTRQLCRAPRFANKATAFQIRSLRLWISGLQHSTLSLGRNAYCWQSSDWLVVPEGVDGVMWFPGCLVDLLYVRPDLQFAQPATHTDVDCPGLTHSLIAEVRKLSACW